MVTKVMTMVMVMVIKAMISITTVRINSAIIINMLRSRVPVCVLDSGKKKASINFTRLSCKILCLCSFFFEKVEKILFLRIFFFEKLTSWKGLSCKILCLRIFYFQHFALNLNQAQLTFTSWAWFQRMLSNKSNIFLLFLSTH